MDDALANIDHRSLQQVNINVLSYVNSKCLTIIRFRRRISLRKRPNEIDHWAKRPLTWTSSNQSVHWRKNAQWLQQPVTKTSTNQLRCSLKQSSTERQIHTFRWLVTDVAALFQMASPPQAGPHPQIAARRKCLKLTCKLKVKTKTPTAFHPRRCFLRRRILCESNIAT